MHAVSYISVQIFICSEYDARIIFILIKDRHLTLNIKIQMLHFIFEGQQLFYLRLNFQEEACECFILIFRQVILVILLLSVVTGELVTLPSVRNLKENIFAIIHATIFLVLLHCEITTLTLQILTLFLTSAGFYW